MSYRPYLNISITSKEGNAKPIKSYRIINRITLIVLLLRIINFKSQIRSFRIITDNNKESLRYGKIKRMSLIVDEGFDIYAFTQKQVDIPEVLIYKDFEPMHDICMQHRIMRKIKQILVDTQEDPMKHTYVKNKE